LRLRHAKVIKVKRQYLSGTKTVDDIESLLYSAQVFLDGGVGCDRLPEACFGELGKLG